MLNTKRLTKAEIRELNRNGTYTEKQRIIETTESSQDDAPLLIPNPYASFPSSRPGANGSNASSGTTGIGSSSTASSEISAMKVQQFKSPIKVSATSQNARVETSPQVLESSSPTTERISAENSVDPAMVAAILAMRCEIKGLHLDKDFSGDESIKQFIRTKLINPLRRPDLHKGLFGFAKQILFYGPPGTGKTLLSRIIASEGGLRSFFDVSSGNLLSKFYGQTEAMIRTLFIVAEALSPSAIFLDEIDSLLGVRREQDEDSTIRMKNQFLMCIDGLKGDAKDVVVIGATNRPDMLDPAALRRFTRRVFIPLPDVRSRTSQILNIVRKHEAASAGGPAGSTNSNCGSCANFPTADSCPTLDPLDDSPPCGATLSMTFEDIEEVARKLEGWNGSDIHALCQKAAELAYTEVLAAFGNDIDRVPSIKYFRPMLRRDFNEALKTVKPSSNAMNNNELYKAFTQKCGSS